MGDFNAPKIDWKERITLEGASRFEIQLLEKTADCSLFNHVHEPTRFRGNDSSTLDLIFTKEEEDVKNVRVFQPLGKSDHGLAAGDFVCEWKSKVVARKNRAYFKGDYKAINEKIDEINWVEKFEDKSTEECWEIFKTIIQELIEKYVPMSTPKDYNEPWMNGKILRLWKKKHYAWSRYSTRKSPRRWREYRKEANKLKKNTRKARRLYERRIAADAKINKRAFFRYVNSRLTVRPEITAMRNGNTVIEDDVGMTNVIGEFFSTVNAKPTTDELPYMPNLCDSQIGNISLSNEAVRTKLEKLNVYKSCAPDDIHPCFLQKTASSVSLPLRLIFEKSLSRGECPADWRTANVTPIHKKGDRTDPNNYRPVSLTSQVCKVLEAIVREKIVSHMKENDLFSNSQHGFREGRSCLTNLLVTLEQWTEMLDTEDSIDVAYLDFRKAFDLVSHRHLLHKMSKYGITGQVLKWVEAFLYQRTQRVVIRGSLSKAFDVTSGVPQGSVLGPVLFLIYINDLPLEILSPLSLFADDSKIFSRILGDKNRQKWGDYDGHQALQDDLNRIQEWARTWKMEFNVNKCKIMHMGNSNTEHTYVMGSTELVTTTEERDLGVIIDHKLDFGRHIQTIVARANRMLSLIRISFACMEKTMFLNLYLVLVRPLLEYCVQVWSPHKKKYINLIEGVQRRATRMVPELRHLEYSERLEKLGLTKLEERRIRGDMIQTYKFISRKENVDPEIFFEMDTPLPRDHSRKIKVERGRLDVRKYNYSLRVAPTWNNLPQEVVVAKKTADFKKGFDKHEKLRKIARENDIYEYRHGNRTVARYRR